MGLLLLSESNKVTTEKEQNHRRYHEGIGDVTLYDVYTGGHFEILQDRKEVKSRTLQVRKDYNRIAREQGNTI